MASAPKICGVCDGTTEQLVSELKRRSPAMLLAYVQITTGNRIQVKYATRGPCELLKMLHNSNELQLETLAQMQTKALKRRIESAADDAKGIITTDLDDTSIEGAPA